MPGDPKMGDLVKAAVDPYPAEYGGCEFVGEHLRIPGTIATSMTMVLHELATNAAKHGALRSTGGKLKVAWRQETSSDGVRQLHISWHEVAAPRPYTKGAADGAGYGTALIDSTIATLGGRIDRSSGDDNFCVRMLVPFG